MDVYLKLIVLLYADDTVVFAPSEETMLQSLELFAIFCDKWKLDINYNKTTVLDFVDKVNRQRNTILRNNRIEVLNEFKYLSVILKKQRKITSMKKHVVEQSKRALFSLYRKIRNIDLSIECQLKLFDNTIVPVLTYGCEI